ncbi:hypothetical protein C8R44DRAFT_740069 [Mycena epipterygia]|nr:hypothetical protein C8R44DRAFT_740069 [Mycena epipterygia]
MTEHPSRDRNKLEESVERESRPKRGAISGQRLSIKVKYLWNAVTQKKITPYLTRDNRVGPPLDPTGDSEAFGSTTSLVPPLVAQRRMVVGLRRAPRPSERPAGRFVLLPQPQRPLALRAWNVGICSGRGAEYVTAGEFNRSRKGWIADAAGAFINLLVGGVARRRARLRRNPRGTRRKMPRHQL